MSKRWCGVRGVGCRVLGPMELGLMDFWSFDLLIIRFWRCDDKLSIRQSKIRRSEALSIFDKDNFDVVLINSFRQRKFWRSEAFSIFDKEKFDVLKHSLFLSAKCLLSFGFLGTKKTVSFRFLPTSDARRFPT